MDAAFTALGNVTTEVRKVDKEAEAARAAHEKALKEAKVVVEHCEEVQARPSALYGKQAEEHRLQGEELKVREAKLAGQEEELCQEASRLGSEQPRLEEQEKDVTTRKTLLEVQEKAFAATEERKDA